jgi:hypothetical protein
MFDHADRLMGIVVDGRARARLDVDRNGKSRRPGRAAAGALALSIALEIGFVVLVVMRAASEALEFAQRPAILLNAVAHA